MDPATQSTPADETDAVFVGPVTQRELIITWKMRRQLKIEQEREEVDNLDESGPNDPLLPVVRAPDEIRDTDDPRKIADACSPCDNLKLAPSSIEVAPIGHDPESALTVEEAIAGRLNVEVGSSVPETSAEKTSGAFPFKDSDAYPLDAVKGTNVSPESTHTGDEIDAELAISSSVASEKMTSSMIDGELPNSSLTVLEQETKALGSDTLLLESVDDESFSRFEDASEDFVLPLNEEGRRSISPKTEPFPDTIGKKSFEQDLDVTPDEASNQRSSELISQSNDISDTHLSADYNGAISRESPMNSKIEGLNNSTAPPEYSPPPVTESFDASPTESAPIPSTKSILRPAKFVVPSTFEGGWGKKLKLNSTNKPKRPAYVQTLNNHDL